MTFRRWFFGLVICTISIWAVYQVGAQTSVTGGGTLIGRTYQVTTLSPQLDVFRTTSQTYNLTGIPVNGTAVMVFYNGLLMLQGLDYSLIGNVLTFIGQKIGDNPIIQVMYTYAKLL